MAKNSLALPDRVVQLLSAADARNGLPAGTLFSVMQQESGGRFLDAPETPHYPTGVAPNGKKSSAFGPFGILESTGAQPGYGVAPLKDKSLDEQIRFVGDYLGGRVKSAGGDLKAGLAGYGEGAPYADQVLARLGNGAPAQAAPIAVAAGPAPQTPVVADTPPAVAVAAAPLTPAPADPSKDSWNQFTQGVQEALAKRFGPAPATTVAATAMPTGQGFADSMGRAVQSDPFGLASIELATRPNMGMFQGLSRIGRRA